MTAPPLGDGSRGILIVEDDESLRRIVARHLRARGYEVEEAASAEDATGALDDGLRPGVVILDVNLPGDTGWDLLRGRAFTAAGSPPVVITSSPMLNCPSSPASSNRLAVVSSE